MSNKNPTMYFNQINNLFCSDHSVWNRLHCQWNSNL